MAAVAERRQLRSRQVGPQRQSNTFWPWFLQRITGGVLVVLLFVHIGVNHFGNLQKPGVRDGTREMIVFSDVAHRLSMWFWWGIDLVLLGFILFHALNGIRNIALDMGVKAGGDRAVSAVLSVIGVVAFGFGVATLIAFRRYA